MERTEAFLAGVAAGRAAEKTEEILNAIEPPESYTDAQRFEFTHGFIKGIQWQRDDDLIYEIMGQGGDM